MYQCRHAGHKEYLTRIKTWTVTQSTVSLTCGDGLCSLILLIISPPRGVISLLTAHSPGVLNHTCSTKDGFFHETKGKEKYDGEELIINLQV